MLSDAHLFSVGDLKRGDRLRGHNADFTAAPIGQAYLHECLKQETDLRLMRPKCGHGKSHSIALTSPLLVSGRVSITQLFAALSLSLSHHPTLPPIPVVQCSSDAVANRPPLYEPAKRLIMPPSPPTASEWPIYFSATASINAPREKVWDTLLDFSSYHSW